jgi:ribosomal protein L30/L7E
MRSVPEALDKACPHWRPSRLALRRLPPAAGAAEATAAAAPLPAARLEARVSPPSAVAAQHDAVLQSLRIAQTKLTRLLDDDPSYRGLWIKLDNLRREMEAK